jgi:hypothetical protein
MVDSFKVFRIIYMSKMGVVSDSPMSAGLAINKKSPEKDSWLPSSSGL